MKIHRSSVLMTVALLVVLAGCSSVVPAGDEAAALDEEEYPPGVTEDGIDDAGALTAANTERLVETGYVADVRMNATFTDRRNLTVVQRETVAPGASSFLFESGEIRAGQRSTRIAWANESTALVYATGVGGEGYERVQRNRIVSQLTAPQLLERYIGTGEYNVTGVNRTDGRTLITLTFDSYVGSAAPQLPSVENVTRYESTVVVDSEGRIHTVDVRMAATNERDVDTSVTVQYDLVRIGSVTVQRPDWVEQATEETSPQTPTSGGY